MVQGRARCPEFASSSRKAPCLIRRQFLKNSDSAGWDSTPPRLNGRATESLRKAAGARVRWIPAVDRVEGLRMSKDAAELAQMRRAAILASEVVQQAIGLLKPGIRELDVGARSSIR